MSMKWFQNLECVTTVFESEIIADIETYFPDNYEKKLVSEIPIFQTRIWKWKGHLNSVSTKSD